MRLSVLVTVTALIGCVGCGDATAPLVLDHKTAPLTSGRFVLRSIAGQPVPWELPGVFPRAAIVGDTIRFNLDGTLTWSRVTRAWDFYGELIGDGCTCNASATYTTIGDSINVAYRVDGTWGGRLQGDVLVIHFLNGDWVYQR